MPSLVDLIAQAYGMSAAEFCAGSTAAPAPAIAEERRLVPAYLSGRCVNGWNRSAGRLVHAVEAVVRGDRVSLASAALCGATYGRRSAGWTHENTAGATYTCARCAKRAALLPK